MAGLGINNNSIKHYLNEVYEVGRGDSENDVAKETGTNGIKQAVSIYYHNVRINLLTLYDSWKTKTERASRKLEELRQDIKNAKAIIDSLSHIRFFRGFLYAFMGILFFLGEVEFSKQTIISAWNNISKLNGLTLARFNGLSPNIKTILELFLNSARDDGLRRQLL